MGPSRSVQIDQSFTGMSGNTDIPDFNQRTFVACRGNNGAYGNIQANMSKEMRHFCKQFDAQNPDKVNPNDMFRSTQSREAFRVLHVHQWLFRMRTRQTAFLARVLSTLGEDLGRGCGCRSARFP
jgi:hypothetical protein